MNEKNKVLTCKCIVTFSVARILEHLYLVGVLVQSGDIHVEDIAPYIPQHEIV